MSNIITREQLIKEKMSNTDEGKYLLKLFKVAEELKIGDEIELQNKFTTAALEVVGMSFEGRQSIPGGIVYKNVENIYYVVELYLTGYYNSEPSISHEEFLKCISEDKSFEIIEEAKKVFFLRMNKLKKIIVKSKKKIPWGDVYYKDIKGLLEQIEGDMRYCFNYPTTPAELSSFYFGTMHEFSKPVMVTKQIGILALEKTLYSLYSELRILTRFDRKDIALLCKAYRKSVQLEVPINLFERVINNYLFATLYSTTPEDLQISKVEASLIVREIKMGTLNSEELINNFINKYEFKDYEVEYLKEYGRYIQKRLDTLKKCNYFGELFIITKPK